MGNKRYARGVDYKWQAEELKKYFRGRKELFEGILNAQKAKGGEAVFKKAVDVMTRPLTGNQKDRGRKRRPYVFLERALFLADKTLEESRRRGSHKRLCCLYDEIMASRSVIIESAVPQVRERVNKLLYKTNFTGDYWSDLVSEGSIGLIKAVDRFDHRVGVRFGTYSGWWVSSHISAKIAEFAESTVLGFHIPRRVQLAKIEMYNRMLEGNDREEVIEEIAEKHRINAETLREVTSFSPALSLEGKGGLKVGYLAEDIGSLEEVLMHNEADTEAEVFSLRLKEEINRVLEELDQRDREIIEQRVMKGRILSDIGDEMNLSRERIRQLEKRAKEKLRIKFIRTRLR